MLLILCAAEKAEAETGRQTSVDPSPPPRRMRMKLPLLSVGIGAQWRLAASGAAHPLPATGPVAEHATDVSIGVLLAAPLPERASFGQSRFLYLAPQLGYGVGLSQPAYTHLLLAGLGVGYGTPLIYGMYTPRFVAGSALARGAVGVRHGLSLQALYGAIGVEVAHEWLAVSTDAGAGGQHDLRLMFQTNILAVVAAIVTSIAGW
jgi:hypothetical protein